MQYELSLVSQIIKTHFALDNALNEQLMNLNLVVRKFIEVAFKDRSSFYISKSMVFVLHKIVNSNESEFIDWASKFTDANSILLDLRLLNKTAVCHDVIVQMQRVFSGRCVRIAAEITEQANNKLLCFSQSNQSETQAAGIEVLRQNVEQTKQDFENTSRFCVTYRI